MSPCLSVRLVLSNKQGRKFIYINITLSRVRVFISGFIIGISSCYWLDGLRIESRWERDFPDRSRLALGTTQPLVKRVAAFFLPGLKRLGRGVNYPSPSCAELKERVELYLHSLFGPSWPVLRWMLPLPFVHLVVSFMVVTILRICAVKRYCSN